MEKVIISGGNGFVGSNTVRFFLDQGIKVTSIDIAEKPFIESDNLTYIPCDIFDSKMLREKLVAGEYDAFIHFAWAGSAGESRVDYELQMRNALMTVECLKISQEIGCKRFVGAGSIMEKEVEAAIHTQGSRPGMGYIYGMGKHVAHCMCKSIAAQIGIDLVWAMITNAYGPGELSPRFLNTTLRKIIRNEPLQFTSAKQNYDFVYISDVAKAFYSIADKGKPFCEYMIGSGKARSLREFIIEIKDVLAPKAELNFGDVPYTGTNMPLDTFDVIDTKKDTGFEAEVPFSKGIRLTMDWLKERENGDGK